jgi:hypothetical protein
VIHILPNFQIAFCQKPVMIRIGFSFIGILALVGCGENGKTPARENKLYVEGPHIVRNDDSARVLYFAPENGSWTLNEEQIGEIRQQEFIVDNPLDVPFVVSVKSESANTSEEYPPGSAIVVVSDIEGNFTGLNSLFVAHNIIDQDAHWIFGNGHLVMLGDLFDRGSDVTPTLWLLYKLEAEARSAGGHVHIVLGNHEIMIFNGDTRYVNNKYEKQCTDVGISYTDLYSTETVLGRWLRSKPGIIKIGDILLSHAGISPEVLELGLTIAEINDLVRRKNIEGSQEISHEYETVFGNHGIFWYRGWVDQPPAEQILDEMLHAYNVGHVVIGHTIVPEIRAAFDHKLIMADVHHARDPVKALLVEAGGFYEINSRGERRSIISD